MHDTGCRAGEVLGLRHEDIAAAECEITVTPRENANGARAKSGTRTVPVDPDPGANTLNRYRAETCADRPGGSGINVPDRSLEEMADGRGVALEDGEGHARPPLASRRGAKPGEGL